ncbi:MAG: MXAN_5187 C-terminal domain-containing protein [Pedobacter sp.]
MDDRKIFQKKLDDLGADLRELELLYERYFSGEEKREPLKQRTELERKIRALSTRRIIKTDHRFRFETLSTRYHTYATHWNRILRLMDEGKYQRHLDRRGSQRPPDAALRSINPTDELYDSLVKAHRECSLSTPPPDRNQFANFLDRQKCQIQERYGKQEVEFRVVIENGKPKLRAKAK